MPAGVLARIWRRIRLATGGISEQDKHRHELEYWEARFREEGPLEGHHYERFYTSLFGLTKEEYRNKRILDIGCGPRGSLEWADVALERVGLDPLADDYKRLGADRHAMQYVAAPSEAIPFPDGHFDVVTAFNSLDHVNDLKKTISEIKRVTKRGATALLIVEINHPPTPTEPIRLREDFLDAFAPEFTIANRRVCALLPGKHDIYGSISANRPAHPGDRGIVCARLLRQ